ncbi:uncharacterized protein [Ptychodera flava]|uniref:uncharacterized protein n=1 Tax=Ptychodera flava TaxID=63121 RepID=UPI00396A8173
MDIQFILDPYACAMYIASYISKAQRGMSNLLSRAVEEAREGCHDIRESVRHIGNKFLNHVEVSAQEAVYLVMQMRLRRASRGFTFINTSPPDDRVILLKPLDDIQNMRPNATDIESDSILKKYERRPKALEKLCLADLAAWYSFQKLKDNPQDHYQDNDDFYKTDEEDDDDENNTIYQIRGLVYKKRTKSKVIRYVRFHREKDKENHYRELIMLFYPWRNENELLAGCKTYYDRYMQVKFEVDSKEKEYNKNAQELDQAIEAVQNTAIDMFDNVAPNTQHQEHQDILEGSRPSDTLSMFAPCDESHSKYDIGQDIGISTNNPIIEDLQQPRMADNELYPLLQKLNKKQKEIFYHIVHWMKTRTEPLNIFVTGGAGVGKSLVLKSLYQVLLKYLSNLPGENPDNIHLLLVAPTGKAAYNIKGTTIHSAFQIPASQGFHYRPLTSERLNTLQAKYRNLKVIFIDEISMVGNGMLNYINLRLQQIMANNKIFGGVSVVSFGDLYQLKPVFDGWIFNDLQHDYGPLAVNIWKDLFKMFELTDIMRQKDDQNFAKLLNRILQQTREISVMYTMLL